MAVLVQRVAPPRFSGVSGAPPLGDDLDVSIRSRCGDCSIEHSAAVLPDGVGDASADGPSWGALRELIFSLSSAYLRLIFTGRKVNCSFLRTLTAKSLPE